jgi:hypothetical protein
MVIALSKHLTSCIIATLSSLLQVYTSLLPQVAAVHSINFTYDDTVLLTT